MHNQTSSTSEYCRFAIASVIASAVAAVGCAPAPDTSTSEDIGTRQTALYKNNATTMWPAGGTVSLCWYQPLMDTIVPNDGGTWVPAKNFIEETLVRTWPGAANIRFAWAACRTTPGDTTKQVRVWLRTNFAGGGASADVGRAAESTASGAATILASMNTSNAADRQNMPGVEIGVPFDWQQSSGGIDGVRYLVKHEFTHVLGFEHEHDRDDTPPALNCPPGNQTYAGTKYGNFDTDSIMGGGIYCGSNQGWLSSQDIYYMRSVYGNPSVTSMDCSVAPGRYAPNAGVFGDIAAPFKDGTMTSVSLFDYGAAGYSGPVSLLFRHRFWDISSRWIAGDFDGDQKTDLANVWNDNGFMTVTTNRSRMGIGVARVSDGVTRTGGYNEGSFVLAGDFDNDGDDDIATVWNDAGLTSIAVQRSNVAYLAGNFLSQDFGAPEAWMTRVGGYGLYANTRWVSGDFDGDGRVDLLAVWNDAGLNSFAARRSTGSSFVTTAPVTRVGGFNTTTRWLAGDFNGDGKADVAGVWNDAGLTSVAVWLATGSPGITAFGAPSTFAFQQGGWVADAKWTVADLNGDGKDDLFSAWNSGGMNVLSTRRSNGSSFVLQPNSAGQGTWAVGSFFCGGRFN